MVFKDIGMYSEFDEFPLSEAISKEDIWHILFRIPWQQEGMISLGDVGQVWWFTWYNRRCGNHVFRDILVPDRSGKVPGRSDYRS